MAKRYITQEILKKKTLADIFAFVLERGQSTRREIECETGFSWGTVSSNVAFLIEKGYIREEKKEQSGAGRATFYLKAASDGIASIGLDINRSGLSCKIVALDSRIIESFDMEFSAKTQSELLSQAKALCQRAVDWCKQNGLRIFSIGIAMQGSVNGREGICVRFPGIEDFGAYNTYNIKEDFAKCFESPVYLGHDPKCMLLGEMHRNRCENCVLLRVDNGIGMAVLLDGRALDDTDRFELGHTLAVFGEGDKGYRLLEECGTLSALKNKGEELFDFPEKYEKELKTAGAHLSRAIYNVYEMFKPDRLILTGKAVMLESFTESALSLLKREKVEITVDSEISAAFGAAVESMKLAIREFAI